MTAVRIVRGEDGGERVTTCENETTVIGIGQCCSVHPNLNGEDV